MKRSIVICGSQAQKEGVYGFYHGLVEATVAAFRPDFEGRPRAFLMLSEEKRMEDPDYRENVATAIHGHFDRVRRADLVFIYNEKGKFGVNTRLEFGYARHLGKPIFTFKELPESSAAYVEAITSTPEELMGYLGEYVGLIVPPAEQKDAAPWVELLRREGYIPIILSDLSARALHQARFVDIFLVYSPKGDWEPDILDLIAAAGASGKPIFTTAIHPYEVCVNIHFHPRLVASPEEFVYILQRGGSRPHVRET
ncbi:MAG: hypothetical protein HY475_03270 [Candidatus Terrybacteria bacterium]|nr:hypothetical protein [Candidatus Terrybacteria bacterium]